MNPRRCSQFRKACRSVGLASRSPKTRSKESPKPAKAGIGMPALQPALRAGRRFGNPPEAGRPALQAGRGDPALEDASCHFYPKTRTMKTL